MLSMYISLPYLETYLLDSLFDIVILHWKKIKTWDAVWICIWVCITPRLQRNWRVHPLFLFLKVPIIRSKLFTVVFIVTYLALLPSFTAINWCPNVYPSMKWTWIKVTFSGILLCVRHCLNSFVLFQFVLYKVKSLYYGIIPSALQCCVRVCN